MTVKKNTVRAIYARLCALCVFRGVLETPLFSRFLAYAREQEEEGKLRAYSAFVGEVYEGGANLTDCVRRAVFENENVYVTSWAKGHQCDAHIAASLDRELETLAAFAALTPADFLGNEAHAFSHTGYEGYVPYISLFNTYSTL